MYISDLFANLIHFLIPNTCPICDDFIEEAQGLCKPCDFDLYPLSDPKCTKCALPRESKMGVNDLCFRCLSEKRYFDQVVAAFEYAGATQRVFSRAKFGHREDAVSRLCEIALDRNLLNLSFLTSSPDLAWTSVPMHPSDLRRRGFNTSRIILDLLRKKGVAGHDLRLLKRTQARIRGNSKSDRESLSRKAFQIRKDSPMPDRVVVVDDVMSSGATLSAIARCLKKAGVKQVFGLVLARKS